MRIERVSETVELDLETLTYLDEHGLRPGVDVELRVKAPDGTVRVTVDGKAVAVGPVLGGRLYAARR